MAWTWVAYIDETYNAEVYWLCSVLVHVDHVRRAQSDLRAVVAKAREERGIIHLNELHGHELWHGEGALEGVAPRVRVAMYDDAVDAIAEAEPRIILRGVAHERLTAHPHRIAWRYAVESIDEEMGNADDGTALVVADEHEEMEHALRTDILSYIAESTRGWKPTTITRVLPELKFFSSYENPLLQAADLVAFLHQRRENRPTETDPRSQRAREMLWAKLEPCIVLQRRWDPPR